MDALSEGVPAASVSRRLAELEARQAELEAALASTAAPAPRLHPNLAELYRSRMADLARLLAEEGSAEAREAVRALVEELRLVPEAGALRVEVRGALGAILALAEGARKDERPGVVAEAFVLQVKMDAGTGFGLHRALLT